jgi:PTS system N-acetylgalactosamine-specific IIA component
MIEETGRGELRGVVVAHGEMARGLVNAVSRITGIEAGILHPVSNQGRSPDQLQEKILEHLGTGSAVVFTDLGAGSCTLAARLSCRDRRRVALVTGVNLPMLLEFVFHREMSLDELLPRLEGKARDGIRILARPEPHVDSAVPD